MLGDKRPDHASKHSSNCRMKAWPHLHDLVADLDRAAEEDVAREGDGHAARVELLQHSALLKGAHGPAAARHLGECWHQHLHSMRN